MSVQQAVYQATESRGDRPMALTDETAVARHVVKLIEEVAVLSALVSTDAVMPHGLYQLLADMSKLGRQAGALHDMPGMWKYPGTIAGVGSVASAATDVAVEVLSMSELLAVMGAKDRGRRFDVLDAAYDRAHKAPAGVQS